MTNEVVEAVAKPAAKVGGKVVAGLGSQVNEGKELWDQIVAWLAEKGVDFAVNAAVALVILLVGALAIKLVKIAVEKAMNKAHRGNSLFSKFICSVITKTCWALLLMVFVTMSSPSSDSRIHTVRESQYLAEARPTLMPMMSHWAYL